MNLNGDYISDALAAQVGGIASRGRQLSDSVAMSRRPRHRAKYAGNDYVNPVRDPVAEMMLRHMGGPRRRPGDHLDGKRSSPNGDLRLRAPDPGRRRSPVRLRQAMIGQM